MPRAPQVSFSPRKSSHQKPRTPSALSPSFSHKKSMSKAPTKASPRKHSLIKGRTSAVVPTAIEVQSDADVGLLLDAFARADLEKRTEGDLKKLALKVSDYVGTAPAPLDQPDADSASSGITKAVTSSSTTTSSASLSASRNSFSSNSSTESAKGITRSSVPRSASPSLHPLPSRNGTGGHRDRAAQREVSAHEAHCSAESCSESESEVQIVAVRKPPPVPTAVGGACVRVCVFLTLRCFQLLN